MVQAMWAAALNFLHMVLTGLLPPYAMSFLTGTLRLLRFLHQALLLSCSCVLLSVHQVVCLVLWCTTYRIHYGYYTRVNDGGNCVESIESTTDFMYIPKLGVGWCNKLLSSKLHCVCKRVKECVHYQAVLNNVCFLLKHKAQWKFGPKELHNWYSTQNIRVGCDMWNV
jgi:hypothetical protein